MNQLCALFPDAQNQEQQGRFFSIQPEARLDPQWFASVCCVAIAHHLLLQSPFSLSSTDFTLRSRTLLLRAKKTHGPNQPESKRIFTAVDVEQD